MSVPYKKSFWDIFKKPEFYREYNYSINNSEINLTDFNNIKSISLSFVYKEKESGKEIETKPLDIQKPVNKTNASKSASEGAEGEGVEKVAEVKH